MEVTIGQVEIEERSIENGDQLEAEQRLNARKHHSRFVMRALRLILQRLLLEAVLLWSFPPRPVALRAPFDTPRQARSEIGLLRHARGRSIAFRARQATPAGARSVAAWARNRRVVREKHLRADGRRERSKEPIRERMQSTAIS